MSDWEEDDDEGRGNAETTYIPPGGRGWFYKTGDEDNFSDSKTKRPAFGRGRGDRFGRNDKGSAEEKNGFRNDGHSLGFGRGFGAQNRDAKFKRGEVDNMQRGSDCNWRDKGNRENSRGFGRNRSGQGRKSTVMLVPSDDIRYIIG